MMSSARLRSTPLPRASTTGRRDVLRRAVLEPLRQGRQIATWLSLGWNLGFAREFLGAGIEAGTRTAAKAGVWKPSETRQTIHDATNKIEFATLYRALLPLSAVR
jgi:hypothetical protein